MKAPASRKARGELAEAMFLAKAMSLGLVVCRPFGDNTRYDFVVESSGGRLLRIQVKSAWVGSRAGYQIAAGLPVYRNFGYRRPYRRSEIDFLVCYLAPEDAWLIIPVEQVADRSHLLIARSGDSAFTEYREAWHLLR